MYGIRIHGRGGQGVKRAAKIIARAAYLAGYKTQDFAVYGAERQGAPLRSFVRIDRKEIGLVGYIEEPDFIIVLDESLDPKETLEGERKETIVLFNSEREKDRKKNHYSVDGTEIALEITGKAIANVAMLGAFTKLAPFIGMDEMKKAIRIELGKLPKGIVEKNLRAAGACYKEVGK